MKYVQPVGGLANDPYTDANPAGGIEGSPVPAAAIEHPMRELVALISDAGLIPTDASLTQVAAAIKTLFQKATAVSAAASGTVDAITANFTPAITALSEHMLLIVRAAGANTSTAPTFTPASATIAAKTIVKGHNQPLVAGDISGAGFRAELQYDAALDKWVLLNPYVVPGITQAAADLRYLTQALGDVRYWTQAQADARFCGIGYMLVRDEKAQGTDGGSTTVGTTVTRELNTVSANTIAGASLSGNQIILPAGKYRINARAPAFGVNANKASLYNTTDAVTSIIGTSENGNNPADSDPVGTTSVVNGRIDINTWKSFELRHYVGNTRATDGLGAASGAGGIEVYSQVEIIKEA